VPQTSEVSKTSEVSAAQPFAAAAVKLVNAAFRSYSLIALTDEALSVHRLVQAVCRDRLDEGDRVPQTSEVSKTSEVSAGICDIPYRVQTKVVSPRSKVPKLRQAEALQSEDSLV